VKSETQILKTDRDKLGDNISEVDVKIRKANQRVKQTRVDIKAKEKELKAFKLLISKKRAETAAEEEPDASADEGQPIVETVFEILDRSSCGAVNKRDFIKGLEKETVSSFFKLPGKIRQEDGSREQMESVFQELAQGGEKFDMTALVTYVGRDSTPA